MSLDWFCWAMAQFSNAGRKCHKNFCGLWRSLPSLIVGRFVSVSLIGGLFAHSMLHVQLSDVSGYS